MKILLAKCPRTRSSHFVENSESLALAYLAGALRAERFESVEILDGAIMRAPLCQFVDRIAESNSDLLGFTIPDATYFESTFQCVRALRDRGVGAVIVLGGYSPSFEYAQTLMACEGIDAVVRFEGEHTFVDLARCVQDRRDWREVSGVAYRCDGSVRANPLRPVVQNLDEFPFPPRDTLSCILRELPETGVVSMVGGRGCYANCSFCSIRAFHDAQGAPAMRLRSVGNIVDEIEALTSEYGVREIVFVDDVFVPPGPAGVRRIEQFIEELERRDLRVMLSIAERAANVTEDTVSLLKRLGVRQVLLGIEAGTDEVLGYYNKHTTASQNQRAIEVLHRLEIDPTVSFINFSPVTTLDLLRQNLDFLLGLRVNFLQGLLNRFQVYPETPLGRELMRQGRVFGQFPVYQYKADDPRTDLVHDVASRSFGLLLTTAFELKRVERKLRQRLFQAEVDGGNLDLMRKARLQFRDLQQGIMEDAASLFRRVLEFAEGTPLPTVPELAAHVEAVRQATREFYCGWHAALAFFESWCPILRAADPRVRRQRADMIV